MGAVYLGQHTLLGRRAAVKVLLPELSARPDAVERFFNEARAVTSISDPGIVQVFDFGYHSDGSAFIVMEYLDGEQLDRRLARVGKLPVNRALRLARQLATSLAAAHARHIVHRDLKPENILLVRDEEVATGERAKILDFGIAKLADPQFGKRGTITGMVAGTPSYMSPEQCRGLSQVDQRSDIYALGCVLFHALVGRPPFDGEGPGDIISAHIREPVEVPSASAPEIPAHVDALVLRCLAKAPADRFQTMHELATAIRQAMQHDRGSDVSGRAFAPMATPTPAPSPMPTPAPLETPVPTTLRASSGQFASVRPLSRRRGLWIAAALAVGAAGIALVRAGTGGSESERSATQAPGAPATGGPIVTPIDVDAGVAAVEPPAEEAAGEPAEEAAGEATGANERAPAVTGADGPRPEPPPRRRGRGERRPVRPPAEARVATVEPPVAPEPAHPPAPIDAGVAPVPAPPPRVEAPVAPSVGSLDATPSLVRLDVTGPLSTADVRRNVARLLTPLRECYRSAARAARATPAIELRLSFEIDESGRATRITASGDAFGSLNGCASSTFSLLRTPQAPDAGTAQVTAVIGFRPS